MKKYLKTAITLFSIGALVFGGIFVLIQYFSVNNQDAELRNKYKSQEQVCQAFYDVMFKTIKQQAQVSDQFASKFKEIYQPLMEGRYAGKDQNVLFKMITEDNPKFTPELYSKLMVTIEAKRVEFFNEQVSLTSIWNEHENLLTKVPSKWFVSNSEHIKHQVVTSTITENVYKNKKDDDVDLFGTGNVSPNGK